jgi:hypothetical protein
MVTSPPVGSPIGIWFDDVSKALTYDSFTNFSIQSPFSNRASGWLPSQFTKYLLNGQEFIRFYLVFTGTPAGNGQLIATLPDGYKPTYTQDYVCSGLGSSTTITPVVEASTDGTLKLYDCATSDSNWHVGWQDLKGPFA